MAGRILIVSNNSERVDPLVQALRRAYFKAILVGERLDHAALRRHRPDLLLIDARDGGRNLALCATLREAPEFVDLPVVALVETPEQAASSFAIGADDVLWDQITPDAACARIRNLSRLKAMAEEVQLREATSRDFGLDAPPLETGAPRILLASPTGALTRDGVEAAARRLGAELVISAMGVDALEEAEARPADLTLVDFGLAPVDDPIALVAALDEAVGGRGAVFTISRNAGAADLALSDGPDALAARLRGQFRLVRLARRLQGGFESGLRLAATDALTGFYNRRYVEAHLGRLFETARDNAAPLAVLMIDIDRFKAVNDRFGHSAGDAALRAFADRLTASIRRCDLAARVGGDEFLVVMPDQTVEQAAAAAERIRRAVAAASIPFAGGFAPAPTISIGVAGLRNADQTPESLLERADFALLDAKRSGRNQIAAAGESAPTPITDLTGPTKPFVATLGGKPLPLKQNIATISRLRPNIL